MDTLFVNRRDSSFCNNEAKKRPKGSSHFQVNNSSVPFKGCITKPLKAVRQNLFFDFRTVTS